MYLACVMYFLLYPYTALLCQFAYRIIKQCCIYMTFDYLIYSIPNILFAYRTDVSHELLWFCILVQGLLRSDSMNSLTVNETFKSLTRMDAEKQLARELQRLLPTAPTTQKEVSIYLSTCFTCLLHICDASSSLYTKLSVQHLAQRDR